MTISANSGSFDRILDQFEERWKTYLSDRGKSECPRLEQYLPAAGAPDARELVWELISLDLYYRLRTVEIGVDHGPVRSPASGPFSIATAKQSRLTNGPSRWRGVSRAGRTSSGLGHVSSIKCRASAARRSVVAMWR
jgi:hypothetical protein